MFEQEDKSQIKLGKVVGVVIAYFVFTTGLFLIFAWLDKMPKSWAYFEFILFTLTISLVGVIIRRLLR